MCLVDASDASVRSRRPFTLERRRNLARRWTSAFTTKSGAMKKESPVISTERSANFTKCEKEPSKTTSCRMHQCLYESTQVDAKWRGRASCGEKPRYRKVQVATRFHSGAAHLLHVATDPLAHNDRHARGRKFGMPTKDGSGDARSIL